MKYEALKKVENRISNIEKQLKDHSDFIDQFYTLPVLAAEILHNTQAISEIANEIRKMSNESLQHKITSLDTAVKKLLSLSDKIEVDKNTVNSILNRDII